MLKRKKSKNAEMVEDNVVSKKEPNKIKKSKSRGSLFKESVVQTSMLDFRNNENFITKNEDGDDLYVGLLFKTEQVGGFDSKKKNEDKGAIVEAVSSGRFATLITEELLNDDSFIIIPNELTIDNMSEFSMLTGINYEVVVVDEDTDITNYGITISFDEVEDVLNGSNKSIDEFLKKHDKLISVDVEEEIPVEQPVLNTPMETPVSKEPAIVHENITDSSFDEEFLDNSFIDEEVIKDSPVKFEDAPMIDEIDEDEDEIIEMSVTEDVAKNAILKVYSGESVVTSVDLNAFERLFNTDSITLFETNRPENGSPVIQSINEISRQANNDLLQLRQSTIDVMRNRYVRDLDECRELLLNAYSLDDGDNVFGAEKVKLDEHKQSQVDRAELLINEKKESLDKQYKSKLENIKEDAVKLAEKTYHERNKVVHDRAIERVPYEVADSIENLYLNDLASIKLKRNDMIQGKFELGDSQVMKDLDETYQLLLEKEQELRTSYTSKIEKYLNDTRKEELLRIDVLKANAFGESTREAMELEHSQRIKTLRNEFEAGLSASKSQYESTVKAMQSDMDSNRISFAKERETFLAQLDGFKGTASEKDMEISKLVSQISDLESRQHEQIETLFKQQESRLKSSRNQAMFVTTVSIITALSLGLMGGAYIGVKILDDLQIKQESVVQEPTSFNIELKGEGMEGVEAEIVDVPEVSVEIVE